MTFAIAHPALTPHDQALLALYVDLPPAPPPADTLCCDAFRRGVFAASIADPTCCTRCWPTRRAQQERERYAWRVVSFGRIRHVPAREAQRWCEPPIGGGPIGTPAPPAPPPPSDSPTSTPIRG